MIIHTGTSTDTVQYYSRLPNCFVQGYALTRNICFTA